MEHEVKATMPGLVARVVVNEGDKVDEGDTVAVVNCMKTEFAIVTERKGVIKEILVKEWDEMEVGSPMIILDVSEEG